MRKDTCGNRRSKAILTEVWPMEFLSDTALWGNPLAEWLQALGYILGSLVMARVVYALFKRVLKRWAARTSTKWDDVVVDQIEEPIAMGIVILGFWLGYDHLHFGKITWTASWSTSSKYLLPWTSWMVARLLDSVISTVILHLDERSDSSMVSHLAPSAENLAFTGVDIGIISGLTNAGYDVGALLAGVGIGGLALAWQPKIS